MSSFSGILAFASLLSEWPTNPALGAKPDPDHEQGFEPTAAVAGALTDTQPIDEARSTHTGTAAPAFGFLDFYNRIHFSTLQLTLGNLVSTQVRPLRIFNAYFVPETLQSLTAEGDEGLSLEEPDSPPFDFAPLQELTYELSAATSGPPEIDAKYTFVFDVGTFEVTVTGARVITWTIPPNWQQPILERLEWATDVQPAFDGSELRVGLRAGAARLQWEFDYNVSSALRRTFENTLYGWGGRVWALPIWPDGELLAAPLSSGAMAVPCNPQVRDYHEGGLAVLLAADGTAVEAIEVEAVQEGQITLARPTVGDWPPGTRVLPARTARLVGPRRQARFTGDYAHGHAVFACTDEVAVEPSEETLYRGVPVFTDRANWVDEPGFDFDRQLAQFDPVIGPLVVDDESELARPLQSFRRTAADRAEIWQLRRWLYARAGRWKHFWLPSMAADLVVVAPINAAATTLDVEHCGLTRFAPIGVNRRDLRIQLADGTLLYRRVTGVVEVNATTERLTIAALGQDLNPEDFALLSWMSLARLDSDTVELEWWTGEVAETSISTVSPRNDV